MSTFNYATFWQTPFTLNDPHLALLQQQARLACTRYNQRVLNDQCYDLSPLLALGITVGANPYLEPEFFCSLGPNLTLGNDVFTNHDVTLCDYAPIHLGDNLNIGPKTILTTLQPTSKFNHHHQRILTAAPITIENGVWLGASVCVTAGVTIGHDTIVGMGSVVSDSLPPHVLAAGNPARVIRPLQP